MLVSARKDCLDSLFKEVRAFKVSPAPSMQLSLKLEPHAQSAAKGGGKLRGVENIP